MKLKKIGTALLFPPVALMIILLPVSVAFLVCAFLFFESDSATAIASYVISAYTLTVFCFRAPEIITFIKNIKQHNPLTSGRLSDKQFRMKLSLYGTLIWNTAYAVFQLVLGMRHHTFWYYSLAGYYISLAVMRFFLVRHLRKHSAGAKIKAELKKYRACGIVFLLMNLALALIIFFMVYWNRTFVHHEITTIALATYTFTSLTFAIINVYKYRRFESPVYSASKAISLAAALVSVLTLTSTMLTTFESGTMTLADRRLLLAVTGGAVSAAIIAMAVYMIIKSTKMLKTAKEY